MGSVDKDFRIPVINILKDSKAYMNKETENTKTNQMELLEI